MPDRKLKELCKRITDENDSDKLSALIDQMIELLKNEQDTIKAKIRHSLSGGTNLPT